MAAILRSFFSASRPNLNLKLLQQCLQIQLGVFGSIAFWILGITQLQAATVNSISSLRLENLSSQFKQQRNNPTNDIRNWQPKDKEQIRSLVDNSKPLSTNDIRIRGHEQLKLPFLLAAPENFNPELRLLPLQPSPPPKETPDIIPPPPVSTIPTTPLAVLDNLQINSINDSDSTRQHNLFIEPTLRFKLPNGNRIRFTTGYDFFEQPHAEAVTDIPLKVGWEGRVGKVSVQAATGVDVFDHLPVAPNLNTQVEVPISLKISRSGRLRSGVVLTGVLEEGPYKFNARTLNNQLSNWRFGPSVYWQINRYTSLFSYFRFGDYSDGNYEQQSFSRLERRIGQFSVAANVFTWNYKFDFENKSGYFSPPDFLLYNGELAWQGNLSDFLGLRLAVNLGSQRLRGTFSGAQTYQARFTAKISPTVEADLGYTYSTVRKQSTEGYDDQAVIGQLRVKF